MLTVFVFVMNVFSLPGVILICCAEFYFAVTVVGHRNILLLRAKIELSRVLLVGLSLAEHLQGS